MLSKIYTGAILGIQAFIVCCETDAGNGLPGIILIGNLSPEIKEAASRVRTALKNSGFILPPKKIVINLSPAEMKKEGCSFDLPIAVGILSCFGFVKQETLENSLFAGELSLSGTLLPIKGVLPLALSGKENGFTRLFLPSENQREGSVIQGISCIGIRTLRELVETLNGSIPQASLPSSHPFPKKPQKEDTKDMGDILGQELLKRATQVAVAGRHNILFIGPAGTGKSMIAARIPSIMPPMSLEERLEVSKIYSVCGLLNNEEPLVFHRPYRSPHHTISPQALAGGGRIPKPGEISLAHQGVLFLDELAEFKSSTMEVLRQPLEEKMAAVSRVAATCYFPADFMLVGATNPCKCGFFPDRSRCHCDLGQVRKYLSKISKPLLDRIDITVETSMIRYDQLNAPLEGENSASMEKKIEEVYQIQQSRFQNSKTRFNAQMNGREIKEFCKLTEREEKFLARISEQKHMSVRGLHKILKVARTIADFNQKREIGMEDLSEAISYRSLEEKYWNREDVS